MDGLKEHQSVSAYNDVDFAVVSLADARVDAVVQALRQSHHNGGVILRAFRSTDLSRHQAAITGYPSGIDPWLRSFFEADSVRAALPELAIPERFDDLPPHTIYDAYEFEGAVTGALVYGGAYHRWPDDDSAARRMSRDFVDAICGTPRDGVVHRIDGAWTNWFYDVAWDQTFVVQRWAVPIVVVLCITDTD